MLNLQINIQLVKCLRIAVYLSDGRQTCLAAEWNPVKLNLHAQYYVVAVKAFYKFIFNPTIIEYDIKRKCTLSYMIIMLSVVKSELNAVLKFTLSESL